jgi:quercetin dioxygenase-like cupin family protein
VQNFYAIEIEVRYQRHDRERVAANAALADLARQQGRQISWLQLPRLALARLSRNKKGFSMRLTLVRTALLTTAFALILTAGLAARTFAQEATPGPIAAVELAPGVMAEVFTGAPSTRAPEQTVYLARFVFQPGSEIFPHGHPGTTILGVQSGSFGWTLVEGKAYVVRGAAAGGTGPIEELTAPGTEVILEPGDAISYEDDVVHTARGAGDEAAVVLGTLVLTSGEPLLMPAEEMAAMTEATPNP